jgi:general secretion pathway protein K
MDQGGLPAGGRRRRPRRRDRRGIALVMVLGAIAVLTIFLTDLQEETTAELSAALAERDRLKAEYHARSAVNLGRLLISMEPTVRSAFTPIGMMMGMRQVPQIGVWKFSDMLLGPFNDQAGAAAFSGVSGIDPATGKNLGLTGGRFELKIVDEDAKINVNLAAKGNLSIADQNRLAQQLLALMNQEQYRPMFEARDADDQFSDSATICSAIIDWADYDDQMNGCNPTAATASAAATGVEDNFYQTIGLDYVRKNAAYDSLEELRMVRGMGDDFWATFVDPDPSDPEKRVMTVWGKPQASINVNTANAVTLLALICTYAEQPAPICSDPVQMGKFLSGISLAQQFLLGAPVFGGPKDFQNFIEGKGKGLTAMIFPFLGIEPVKIDSRYARDFRNAISTDTKFFSIYAEGVVPGNKRETRVRIHAVIDISGAQALGQITADLLSQLGGGAGSTGGAAGLAGLAGLAGATGASGAGAAASPQAYEQVVRTNPAGTIVYWRIE